MPLTLPDWDFTLYFTDDELTENAEAVTWLQECEDRIRKELTDAPHDPA